MSARSLIVLLVLAVAGMLFWIFDLNRALMHESLSLWTLPGQTQAVRIPVGQGFVFAMAFGAVAIAFFWGLRSTRSVYAALMERRSSREEREAEALYHRGLETMLDGRPQRALTVMSDVLRKDPDHPGALMSSADVLRQLGRPGEAVELRQKRLAVSPDDVAVLHALAEDYRAQGDLDLAAATFERILSLRPKDSMAAAERLREVLIEAGHHERAIAAHDRLVKMREGADGDDADLDRAGIETRWAMKLAEQGRSREAVSMLRRVLKRHPRYVPGYLALAGVHALAGDEDAAVETWIEGFERTNEAAILVDAEEHFLESRHDGDPIERAEAALRAFKRFAACSGPRPLALAFLGKLYVRHEMLDEAAAAFDAVREVFPDNATFLYYSARIAEKQGRPDAASGLYRTIIKSLGVLGLRYRCRACGERTGEFADRCAACRRWGTIALELGNADDDTFHPARPLYAVPGDDTGRVEQDALA